MLAQTVKPITPADAKIKKLSSIPFEVIASFNELIAENLDISGRSSFTQDAVMDRILSKYNELSLTHSVTRRTVFDNKWLDVEDLFREQGWKVTYDKPDYTETFPARFEFKPSK